MHTNCNTQTRKELKIKNNTYNKRQAKKGKNKRFENGQAEIIFILILFVLFILFLSFIFSIMSGDFIQIKSFLQSIFGG